MRLLLHGFLLIALKLLVPHLLQIDVLKTLNSIHNALVNPSEFHNITLKTLILKGGSTFVHF